ncbi:uncharacterized protein LOC106646406, partial [Copidosoma floridanum]|uniref:uncharacterized protein LOC106646406 n=1 Tax=Copidosoma floridanum TaxID=29053 RepID=UPI0006C9D0E8
TKTTTSRICITKNVCTFWFSVISLKCTTDRSNKTDVANGVVDEVGLGASAATENPSSVVAAIPAATGAIATAAAAAVAAIAVTAKDECVAESVSSRCNCERSSSSSSKNAQSHTGGIASIGLTDSTRPSYAQVAQHSRELPCAKHKADEKDDIST